MYTPQYSQRFDFSIARDTKARQAAIFVVVERLDDFSLFKKNTHTKSIAIAVMVIGI